MRLTLEGFEPPTIPFEAERSSVELESLDEFPVRGSGSVHPLFFAGIDVRFPLVSRFVFDQYGEIVLGFLFLYVYPLFHAVTEGFEPPISGPLPGRDSLSPKRLLRS